MWAAPRFLIETDENLPLPGSATDFSVPRAIGGARFGFDSRERQECMRLAPFALRSPALLLVLLLLPASRPATGQEDRLVAGPDLEPLEFLRQAATEAISAGIRLEETEGSLVLEVDGEAHHQAGRAVLVEPGEQVRLRATLRPSRSLSGRAPMSSGELSPRGFLRHTTMSEIIWEAEPEDMLIPMADGTVAWRAGGTSGGASYVSAQAAELHAHRWADRLISSGGDLQAPTWSGRTGVLLLSGVAFDRSGDGILHGQNIGIYPNERSSQAPRSVTENAGLYRPPGVFYRLDERTREARVLPNLTLGEMMPPPFPQEADTGTRYVAISPRLLQFLEELHRDWIAAGHDPRHLAIIRGFVSPTDRLRLERQGVSLAEFSRFQYGDAVALVYDPRRTSEEEAGAPPRMADFNGDGEVTVDDAEAVAELVKATMDRIGMYGGLGIVESFQGPGPSTGTPYVHIDLRGWYSPFRE